MFIRELRDFAQRFAIGPSWLRLRKVIRTPLFHSFFDCNLCALLGKRGVFSDDSVWDDSFSFSC